MCSEYFQRMYESLTNLSHIIYLDITTCVNLTHHIHFEELQIEKLCINNSI